MWVVHPKLHCVVRTAPSYQSQSSAPSQVWHLLEWCHPHCGRGSYPSGLQPAQKEREQCPIRTVLGVCPTHHTAPHHTTPYRTARHHTTPHATTLHATTPHHTPRHHTTTPHHTAPHCTPPTVHLDCFPQPLILFGAQDNSVRGHLPQNCQGEEGNTILRAVVAKCGRNLCSSCSACTCVRVCVRAHPTACTSAH